MSKVDESTALVSEPVVHGASLEATHGTSADQPGTARLANGSVSDVVGFAEQLSWALYRLDRKEYGDGLSSDQFLHTRAAVVTAGRVEYESVVRDPQRFLPYAHDLVWAEALLYVPDNACRHPTGAEWDHSTRHSYESYSNTAGWINAKAPTAASTPPFEAAAEV
ncbi:DUF4240 domain-containing protein [Streptomyces sp. NPDC053086]|uniref:DUF4240 domain-containing protein n=1 Tax=unclassified Streptomyces TaxID=2593676 RepID=UPI0037D48526